MKKFLALVLTLAMVLTLNVGMVVGAAAADAKVDVTGKETVDIDGVTYKVISDLAAVSTKGNYILSGDVAVALEEGKTLTFAAGTVLHGNGYTITVEGNDFENPLNASPFVLEVGEAITITDVNFGTVDAPFTFISAEPLVEGEEVAELSIFASDVAPEKDEEGNMILEGYAGGATANFVNVDFAFVAADELNTDVSAVMATAWGTYTLDNCNVYCEITAGDMNETDPTILTEGYAAGFFARVEDTAVASFNNCSTVFGSIITNDYRTGGFVGKVDGGINISNCVNNAKITNLVLVTGGFIGYVSGETLTEWTFNNNVNYGEITAYTGPAITIEGKNTRHGDAGYSAGSMWGYIYKDTDNTAPVIVASNCINYGNVYGEDRLSGMFGDNRLIGGDWKETTTTEVENPTLGIVETITTETQKYEVKTAIYENCVNYGDVLCIVVDATPGAYHIIGGFTARLKGPTVFRGCVNYGRIDGKGMRDSNLGGIVANSADANAPVAKMNAYFADNAEGVKATDVTVKVTYENCVNYGLIENGRRIGGLVGTVEAQSEFIGCQNFGTVISGQTVQTDTDAAGIAGFHDQNPVEMTGCVNFGTVIAGASSAGGMIGYSRNNKYGTVPAINEIIMDTCFNFGDIILTDGSAVGGLIGNAQTVTTVTDSLNAGMIEATATGRVGQLLGNAANTLTVSGCYMFGTFGGDYMPANYDGVLEFLCSASITVPEGETMATIIGTADDVTDERNAAMSLDDAYAFVAEMFGAEDTPIHKGENGLVFAYAAIRGAQFTAEAEDGKADLRFVGKALNIDDATKVEFTYKVNNAAAVTVEGFEMETLYATTAYGSSVTKTAATIGGDNMYVVVIEDVAVVGEVTVEVSMTVTNANGTFTSNTVSLTFVDGVLTELN